MLQEARSEVVKRGEHDRIRMGSSELTQTVAFYAASDYPACLALSEEVNPCTGSAERSLHWATASGSLKEPLANPA